MEGVGVRAQLACAVERGDCFCFTYNELPSVFVPWGYNRELLVVGAT